jgi:hypothetical protein
MGWNDDDHDHDHEYDDDDDGEEFQTGLCHMERP